MIFEHENVVIGEGLRAAMFAYIHKYPLFFTRGNTPQRFDYLSPELKLECVGIPDQRRRLSTPSGFLEVGIPKRLLWERLIFLLSLEGLLPLSDLCVNIRDNGQRIVCTNEYSKIYEFNFNTCYYFGDSGVLNINPEASSSPSKYICYDYVAFHKGGKHEIDYISTDDDFVSEIWFYSSDRIDGNTGVKDACVVSRLNKKQLRDPNYSETMARFKMEKVLRDNGMRGPINGYTPSGRPKHYNFKTSHIYRSTFLRSPLGCTSTDLPTEIELIQNLQKCGLLKYESLKCDYTLPA